LNRLSSKTLNIDGSIIGDEKMKAKTAKIFAMLVCIAFVATAVPTVSATTFTLTAVSDPTTYVMIKGNQTADTVNSLLGTSLATTDTLYVDYYNITGVLTATSFASFTDSSDVVWFNISLPETGVKQVNTTWRQVWFSDAAITDPTAVDCALYVNQSITATANVFIISIPDGVGFTYKKYTYTYDDGNFTATNAAGTVVDNLSSYNYSATCAVYSMDLSDTASTHQIVIVGTAIQTAGVATAGERVTVEHWYGFDTAVPYTMSVESGTACTTILSTDGYVAFNVYNDYAGLLAKYVGGKTPFRLTATTFKYGTHKWYWPFSTTWTSIATHGATIAGIKVGLVERIYYVKGSSSVPASYVRSNFGVLTSKGTSTTDSGVLDYLEMGPTRVPDAIAFTGKAVFA